jgi:ornithine carbamoyltransferase
VEKVPGDDAQRHGRQRTLLRLTRHFLTGSELSAAELSALIGRAQAMKAAPLAARPLDGRTIALIFQRPSTRTRVSFEAGIHELGGHPMVLRTEDLQLSRGESVRDTAYVLSRHAAGIAIRTGPDALLEEFAQYSSVPIVNMLTAGHHPVQALADLLTLQETFGRLEGLKVAYVGDGNNVARSLAILGALAGVEVRVAAPEGYQLEPVAGAILTDDPEAAADGVDALYADVWVSMNDDPASAEARRTALAPYRLDERLMARAAPGAIALHCLPAHPGEEISEGLLYGERQRIWDQAENRRHAQKALLELLIS